jgi:hypothetical protein
MTRLSATRVGLAVRGMTTVALVPARAAAKETAAA